MIAVVIRTTLVQDTDSRGDVPMWDKEYVCIWEISVLLVQFFCGPKVAQKKKKSIFYKMRMSITEPSQLHNPASLMWRGTVIRLREDQDFVHDILFDFTLSTPGTFPRHVAGLNIWRICFWSDAILSEQEAWEELIQSSMTAEHQEVSMLTYQQCLTQHWGLIKLFSNF